MRLVEGSQSIAAAARTLGVMDQILFSRIKAQRQGRLRAELARVKMERDTQGHRRVWPISVQCRVLGVSVTGYHTHCIRRTSGAQRRHLSDDALLVHIKAIHAETRSGYGWPRIWRALLARGIWVGKHRMQQLMQRHDIIDALLMRYAWLGSSVIRALILA